MIKQIDMAHSPLKSASQIVKKGKHPSLITFTACLFNIILVLIPNPIDLLGSFAETQGLSAHAMPLGLELSENEPTLYSRSFRIFSQLIQESCPRWFHPEMAFSSPTEPPFNGKSIIELSSPFEDENEKAALGYQITVHRNSASRLAERITLTKKGVDAPEGSVDLIWNRQNGMYLLTSLIFTSLNQPQVQHIFSYDSIGRICQHTLRGNLSGSRQALDESYSTRIQYDENDPSIVSLEGDDGVISITRQASHDKEGVITWTLVETADKKRYRKCIREYEHIENEREFSTVTEVIEDDSPSVIELFNPSFSWRRWTITKTKESERNLEREECIETWSFDPSSGRDILLRKMVIKTDTKTNTSSFLAFDETGSCIYSSQRGFPKPKTALNGVCSASMNEDVYPLLNIDGLGRVVSLSHEGKSSTEFREELSYDSFGNLTSLYQSNPIHPGETPAKTHIRARYTARGQIALKQYEDGSKEASRYFLNGQLAKHTLRDGYIIAYTKDGFGQITSTSRRKRGTTETHRRLIDYDGRGNVIRIINPQEKSEENLSYDIFDRLITYSRRIAGKDDTSYSISYDALDRPIHIQVKGPVDSSSTSMAYDMHGQKRESRTIYKRDGKDETIFVRELFNQTTGLLQEELSETSEDGISKQTLFDDQGRKAHIRISSLKHTFEPLEYLFSYKDEETKTLNGKIIKTSTRTTIMPNRAITHEVFDACSGRMLSRTVDTQGKVLDTIQGQAPIRSHEEYIIKDSFGSYDVIQETILSSGKTIKKVISWTFGPNKRLESIKSSDGIEEIYSYDAQGRLKEKKKVGLGSLLYERNEHGQVTRLYSTDNTVDYSYSYDNAGRIIKAHDNIKNKSVNRSFDRQGRLYQDGEEEKSVSVDFAVNDLGTSFSSLSSKVTKISLPTRESIVFSYLDSSRTKPSRIDKLYEEKTVWSLRTDQVPILKEKCQFEGIDEKGFKKVTKKSSLSYPKDNKDSIQKSEWTQTAHIDSFGFLSQEKGEFSYSTSFLPSGEITSFRNDKSPSQEEKVEIDRFGRVVQKGGLFLSYDQRGNVSASKDNSNQDQITYTYDFVGRLTSIENKKTGFKEEYEYDGFHRIQRIIQTTRLNTSSGEKPFVRHIIDRLWYSQADLGSIVYTEDGKVIKSTLRVPALSSNHHETSAVEINGRPYITAVDSNYSVIALIDSDGIMVEQYFYSLFGHMKFRTFSDERSDTTEPLSPWLWCGKRQCGDSSFLLYDFGYRRYSSTLMHWVEEDPLGWSDGLYSRSYVQNNPIFGMDPTGLFSIPSFWNQLTEHIQRGAYEVYTKIVKSITLASTSVDWFFQFRSPFEDMIFKLVGSTWLMLIGYNPDATHVGRAGSVKELHPKVRITHINGILNVSKDQVDNAALVSKSHGNIPVHYIYAATSGFTGDLLRCAFAKGGLISRQAKLLSHLWQRLIKEMGGPHEGGIIIHYAHSLGGTDTASALTLLTPEERACIRVVTFGSATLIQEESCYKVDNYVSVNDAVPAIADIKSYFYGLMKWQNNIYFLSSNTLPCVDHIFTNETYRKVLDELGAKFQEEYLKEQKDNKGN